MPNPKTVNNNKNDILSFNVQLQIWDTAGQERFRVVTRSYYKGAHAICLVFDLTDVDSFSHISNWVQNIRSVLKSNNTNNVPIVLVGNKSDCSSQQRKISKDKAINAANEFGLSYFETSARTGQNVVELLESVSRIIIESKSPGKHDTNLTSSQSNANPVPSSSPSNSKNDLTLEEKKGSKSSLRSTKPEGKGCHIM